MQRIVQKSAGISEKTNMHITERGTSAKSFSRAMSLLFFFFIFPTIQFLRLKDFPSHPPIFPTPTVFPYIAITV